MPHVSISSGSVMPYQRAYARIASSTARPCLRRASDFVNSKRRASACCRRSLMTRQDSATSGRLRKEGDDEQTAARQQAGAGPCALRRGREQPAERSVRVHAGEIRFKAGGNGEGKLVPRAKITYDRERQTIEIEDYASQPVRLTQVRANKAGRRRHGAFAVDPAPMR